MSRTNVTPLCVACVVLISPAMALPQEEPGELTEQQRKELLAEADRLFDEVVKLHRSGKPVEALEVQRKELALRRRLHGDQDHPDVARSLNAPGFLLWSMGRHGEALPYFERALRMYEALYPEERFREGHPDLATSVGNMGMLLRSMEEYGEALPYFERALRMNEVLYPKERYPVGHSGLALSINNMGFLLHTMGEHGRALPHYERALRMNEALYPKERYPRGHPDLANSIDNMGGLFESMGEYAKALPYHERALRMTENLYPEERYPRGHPELARSVNNMAGLLRSMGEYGKALPHYERTLRMRERLYPVERYPRGHPDLAVGVDNMGLLLQSMGEYEKALPFHERALRMFENLYPEERYPRGHPDLATSVNNMGTLLRSMGEYGKALPHYERALRMAEALYPEDRYPRGHPHRAAGVNNMAGLLRSMGEYEKALPYYERALRMAEALYPKERYPRGHPNLAMGVSNMGTLLRSMGEYEKALPFHERALGMYGRLAQRSALSGGLAEGLALIAAFPDTRSHLLSTSRRGGRPSAAHESVWATKGSLARLFRSRRALARAANPKEFATRLADLADVQRTIGGLLVKPVPEGGDADRDRELTTLTERQSRLEAEVARLMPEGAQPAEYAAGQLARAMRPGDVFLDLYLYYDYAAPKAERDYHYVGFLLAAGGDPVRVELGPAEHIDDAVNLWLGAVRDWSGDLSPAQRRDLRGRADGHARTLRRLLWEPIGGRLPADTERVYLSPDGGLGRVPFAAIPGEKPGSVLLEEYAFAVVESGPFLLEGLPGGRDREGAGALLAVGGVRYDRPDAPEGGPWPYLKGAEAELRQVLAVRGGLGEILTASGHDATTDWLLGNLPKARYAHLATHGQFRAEEYAEEQRRLEKATRDRIAGLAEVRSGPSGHSPITGGQGVRNPLGYVELVMAGANDPAEGSPDRGVISGTSIWPLDLSNMELAVLSACETGLGEYTRDAGVQNLAMAFHVAGCDNVIASLWKVDDQATAALMAKFYHGLWVEKRPAIEALREAQLLVYKRPDLIPDLAGTRGAPRRKEALDVTSADPAPEGRPEDLPDKTPAKYWAAFTLSGVGR